MSDLVKPKKITLGPPKVAGGLHSRLADASFTARAAMESLEHKIVILPDLSGSMSERADYRGSNSTKLDLLKDALTNFVQGLDTSTTACGMESFPAGYHEDLSNDKSKLWLSIQTVRILGDTPMGHAMRAALAVNGRSRIIIVSDGEATDGDASYDAACQAREAKVPCDCVHIGDSSAGEERLKCIAEMTRGIYIKFTNVQAFAKSFEWLLPQRRSQLLLTGAAQLLGAKEISHG